MSKTACPHCGSTNSIDTAGQTYCADCGQLISGAKKATKESPPKKSAQKSVAVAHKAPSKAIPKAPVLDLKAIEAAKKNKKTAAHSAKKSVAEPIVAVPDVVESVATAEMSVPVLPAKRFRHLSAIKDGFRSLRASRTLSVALVATLITTTAEVIFASLFAQSAITTINQSIAAGNISAVRTDILIDHLGWVGLLGFVGYLAYHYASAAIIFRTSRAFDRRGVRQAEARRAALGSLAGMFGIDTITWTLGIILTASIVAANIGFIGTKSLGAWGIALAVLTNLVAMYIWLGLISARHMAYYAIILGQVGLRRAYSTGWALYNRQFGRVTIGLVNATLITIGLVGTTSAATRLLPNNLLGNSLTSVLIALAQAVSLVVISVYLLRLYRFLIAREYDARLGQLLSGRQPRQSHVRRRVVVLTLISLVWIAGMAWLITR